MTKSIAVFFLCMGFLASQAQDCDLKKDSNGIKVYACFQDTSKYKLLKAEFTLENTTIDQLVTFLLDAENYLTWQYNMEEVKVVKTLGENSFIYRSVTDAPWPVTDREMIIQFDATKNEVTHRLDIHVHTVPFNYPKNNKLVRIPYSDAKWVVTVDGNNLKVLYSLNIDPGGSIPAWLVNIAIAEGPFESFSKLKKQLEKRN